VAHLLARDFSDCTFAINGGLLSIDQSAAHLDAEWLSPENDKLPRVHSAMVGRSAWYNPWDVLGQADTSLYGCSRDPALSRRQVIDDYLDYVDRSLFCRSAGLFNNGL
jgi:tRNA-dihydrouridine synthase A